MSKDRVENMEITRLDAKDPRSYIRLSAYNNPASKYEPAFADCGHVS